MTVGLDAAEGGRGPGPAGGAIEPPPPPALGECLAATFRCARVAWSPGLLAAAWLAAIAGWLLWERLLAGAPPAARWAGGAATALAVWPLAGLTIAVLAWEFGRERRLGLREGLGLLGARVGAVFGGPLIILGGIGFLLAIAAVGPAVLGWIPGVGPVVAWIWVFVPGLVFLLMAAGLSLLGVPALPLVLASAAVEEPYPFDAASRGLSYLRARPCRYLGLLGAGVLGSAAGAAAFAAFVVASLAMVLFAGRVATAGVGGSAAQVWADRWTLLGAMDLSWPFRIPGLGQEFPVVPWLAGRAVTAFAGLSVLSAVTRTYLFLRWEIDGDPPAAQVGPGESFAWEEP